MKELMCEKHWNDTIAQILPGIFVYLLVHDEIVWSPKFMMLAKRIGDYQKAGEEARPWCCFIGEVKMKAIYNKVYEEVVLKLKL